jgi:hypothetical protein
VIKSARPIATITTPSAAESQELSADLCVIAVIAEKARRTMPRIVIVEAITLRVLKAVVSDYSMESFKVP